MKSLELGRALIEPEPKRNLITKIIEEGQLVDYEELKNQTNKGILLFDGSASSQSTFCEGIYDSCSYSDLDRESIEKEIEINSWFLDVIRPRNRRTIKDITLEIAEYKRIIDQKKEILDRSQSYMRPRKRLLKPSKKQQLFEEVVRLSNEIVYFSRRSELKNRSLNSSLTETIREIMDVTKIKEPYSRNPVISDTDISLASALFYQALIGQNPSLLTKDSHFLDIASVVPKVLYSDGLVIPEFKIYFRDSDSTKLYAFNSEDLKSRANLERRTINSPPVDLSSSLKGSYSYFVSGSLV
jgi:hypothetical protein